MSNTWNKELWDNQELEEINLHSPQDINQPSDYNEAEENLTEVANNSMSNPVCCYQRLGLKVIDCLGSLSTESNDRIMAAENLGRSIQLYENATYMIFEKMMKKLELGSKLAASILQEGKKCNSEVTDCADPIVKSRKEFVIPKPEKKLQQKDIFEEKEKSAKHQQTKDDCIHVPEMSPKILNCSTTENQLRAEYAELNLKNDILMNDQGIIHLPRKPILETEGVKGNTFATVEMMHPSDNLFLSPFKRLVEMKTAFDRNQKLLLEKEKEIEEKNHLILEYEAYFQRMQEDILCERLKVPSDCKGGDDDLDHLTSTLQGMENKYCVIASKNEALVSELEIVKKQLCTVKGSNNELRADNVALKQTISSLGVNIDQLVEQNEKLMFHIHQKHETNPCTSSATENERKRNRRNSSSSHSHTLDQQQQQQTVNKGCGDCLCEHTESEFSSSQNSSFSFVHSPGTAADTVSPQDLENYENFTNHLATVTKEIVSANAAISIFT